MKRQKMEMSNLYCDACNFKMVIPRKRGSMREKNHVKHMYCPKCKETQAFIETYQDNAETYWEQWQESFSKK